MESSLTYGADLLRMFSSNYLSISLSIYLYLSLKLSIYLGIVVEDLKEINTTVVDVIMAVKRDKQALTPSSLISGKKKQTNF